MKIFRDFQRSVEKTENQCKKGHIESTYRKKIKNFSKNIAEKFGVLKFCRTFAIPKQSGGGEMVDTLL